MRSRPTGRSLRSTRSSQQQNRRSLVSSSNAAISLTDFSTVPPHYLGPLNKTCVECGALHFANEIDGNKGSSCCHKGKVKLTALKTDNLIQSLLTGNDSKSKNYRANIRSFNAALSMISTSANVETSSSGPYFYKIHGQVLHRLGSFVPEANQTARYAQTYYYDVEVAAAQRLNAEANNGCDPDLMNQLSSHLSQINPFAQSFRAMATMYNSLPQDEKKEVTMIIHVDKRQDQRRYNDATVSDVAAIFRNSPEGIPESERDIVVHPRIGQPQIIPSHSPNLDPMAYPLLFPCGDKGWTRNLHHHQAHATVSRNKLTMLQFVSHRLAIRDGFSIIHSSGKLFLQWIVDLYVRIEGERLAFIRSQQSLLRAECYMNVMDYIHQREGSGAQRIGQMVILPSSFIGSPRNMQEKYQDAMAIVREFGKPDLFITMTCNPTWPEIKENLKHKQASNERPDLIARVFKSKLDSLIDDIRKKEIFGKVDALIYTIEFQKRGLPHAHILVSLAPEFKLQDIEQIDSIVCATIPDPSLPNNETLHKIVKKNMIHGPCGIYNPNSPCMLDGKCCKGFPREYAEESRSNPSGFPIYRRPNDGITVSIDGNDIDNRFVVPYNPFLLLKNGAHINVEACSTVKSVKYVYKYIYKGHDACTVAFGDGDSNSFRYDEVLSYLNARYVGSAEAIWRIFEYPMHFQSHTVIKLECHLPNQQRVYFQDQEIDVETLSKDTKLLAWFKLNINSPEARELLYTEIPQNYTWHLPTRSWRTRQRGGGKVVTRLYMVSPKNIELFHMRILLLNIKGATSYDSLKTVNGVVHRTFLEAALAHGLVRCEEEYRNAISEACGVQRPSQVRNLFGVILALNNPNNALDLWTEFKAQMIEDHVHDGMEVSVAENMALLEINEILITHNTSCSALSLPTPTALEQQAVSTDQDFHLNLFNTLYETCNSEQKEVIDTIISTLDNDAAEAKIFYLDAPAGCGKTYIQRVLMSYVKSKNQVVLPVAFTGIAASLVEGGRTLHNQFKLPIPIFDTSVSSVTPNSPHGQKLLSAKMVIIDEASMMPSAAFTVINRLFQDLANTRTNTSSLPFAGKLVLLCGDFRQTLPVVPHGSRSTTVENCLKSNPLWRFVRKLNLTQNMRVNEGQDEFARYLLTVGNGKLPKHQAIEGNYIFPKKLLGTGSAVDFVYGDLESILTSSDIADYAVLAPRNEDCNIINNIVLSRMNSDFFHERNYISMDEIVSDNEQDALQFPTEYLNSIELSGLPRHNLKLKVGAVVLLMRNLNTAKSLINGTRLRVIALHNNSVDCEVLTGSSSGNRVLIPRIKLTSSDSVLPLKIQRFQFPLCLAFAMTINKSQGQSLKKVALHLPKPVFTHGQLYVALSRCTSEAGVKIFIDSSKDQYILDNGDFTTKNPVYYEIL